MDPSRASSVLFATAFCALTMLAGQAVGQEPPPKPADSSPKLSRPATEAETKAEAKAKPPAVPSAKKKAGAPSILSRSEADRTRPKSSFLNAPGGSTAITAGKYDSDELDWRDIPPWRQTSFFNIRARGQFFIFVVDGSGSMIDEDRFPRATMELRRSVFALQSPQKFEVIFYNDLAIPMPGGAIPRSADARSKAMLLEWLRLIEPEGGTDPLPALSQAIALNPDAVFFLSDGALPDGIVEAIAKLNRRKVPIHCVDLAGGQAGDQLRRISKDNNGQYASRAGSLQSTPPAINPSPGRSVRIPF